MIELPPTPEVFSVATYASTILIRSIMGVGTCPILYQFLELRASDPDERNVAGDTGMMVSLITQLLPHVLQDPGISLEFLAKEPFGKASRDPLSLFLIFELLLRSLPKDVCVYIVLDAIRALRKGEKGEEEGVLGKVLGLMAKEDVFVKILISGPSSDTTVESMKSQGEPESHVSRLYVPEYVGGDYQRSETAWVEQQVEDLIRGL